MKEKLICIVFFVLVVFAPRISEARCSKSGCYFSGYADNDCYNHANVANYKYSSSSGFCPNEYWVQCSLGHCENDAGGKPWGREQCEIDGVWNIRGYCVRTIETYSQQCPPYGYSCYCNCWCFAHGTLITLADGSVKQIQQIEVGEEVLVLDDLLSANSGKPVWKKSKVAGSYGTGNDTKSSIARIEFGENYDVVLASLDQVFYAYDKDDKQNILVRAANLQLHKHQLLDKEGNKLNIKSLVTGIRDGGLWHIMFDPKFQEVQHHLFLAQGVVVGDFFLQHNTDIPYKHISLYKKDLETKLGSVKYNLKYGDPFDENALHRLVYSKRKLDENFTPYHKEFAVRAVPPRAKGFLSRQISENPYNFGDYLKPPSETLLYQEILKVIAVWQVLRPEIDFHFEWNLDDVNIYGWKAGAKRHIQVQGGLVRHSLLGWRGVALLIARQIEQLFPIKPEWTYDNDSTSLLCERYADYRATTRLRQFGTIMADGFTPDPWDLLPPAAEEVDKFLHTLPQDDAVSTACGFPSVKGVNADCRALTFKQLIFGPQPLPDCWQVPPEEGGEGGEEEGEGDAEKIRKGKGKDEL